MWQRFLKSIKNNLHHLVVLFYFYTPLRPFLRDYLLKRFLPFFDKKIQSIIHSNLTDKEKANSLYTYANLLIDNIEKYIPAITAEKIKKEIGTATIIDDAGRKKSIFLHISEQIFSDIFLNHEFLITQMENGNQQRFELFISWITSTNLKLAKLILANLITTIAERNLVFFNSYFDIRYLRFLIADVVS